MLDNEELSFNTEIPTEKTYREHLNYAKGLLRPMCLKMEDLEARELTAYAARMSGAIINASELHGSRLDAIAPVSTALILDDVLARRLSDEPLALIIGEWDFYGITLKTARGVLIPRADTETVVEKAADMLKKSGKNPQKILDLCCGTGCIGIAMMSIFKDCHCTFGDISDKALELTRENVKSTGYEDRSTVMELDALDDLVPAIEPHSLDLLISNPPYITSDEMLLLPVSVAAFEPHDALYGGVDGLSFYRCIAYTAREVLKDGAMLVFECGDCQADDIEMILRSAGYADVGHMNDLNDKERVVWGTNKID